MPLPYLILLLYIVGVLLAACCIRIAACMETARYYDNLYTR